jgi:hypothetical protein
VSQLASTKRALPQLIIAGDDRVVGSQAFHRRRSLSRLMVSGQATGHCSQTKTRTIQKLTTCKDWASRSSDY